MSNAPNIRQRAPIGAGPRAPIGTQTGRLPSAGPGAQANPPRTGGIQPQTTRGPAPMGGGIQAQSRNLSRPAGGAVGPRGPSSGTHAVRGYAAIRAQHERETVLQQQREQERGIYMPHRFYLPDPTKPGITPEELEANIVVLDHEPYFAIHEHHFPNPRTGKFDKHSFFQTCMGEGHCPACDADQKDPYWVLFLSVIDMRGFEIKEGPRAGQWVPHSRKLLAIKNKNQNWWFRKFEQYGTLRGMQVLLVRDDRRGANHGNPEFVALHDEAAILESFGHPAVYSTQDPNKIIKQENEDCFPFDYDALFPTPNYEAMLVKFGGNPAAGSRADHRSTWGADADQFNGIQRGRPGGIQPQARQHRADNFQQGDDIDGQYNPDLDDEIPFDGAQPQDGNLPESDDPGSSEGSTRGTGHTPEDDIPL